jgi:uncharacterized membrane protein YjjP (DUF1212 family)
MIKNKKTILAFITLILVGFCLATGTILPYVFYGGWWFVVCTIVAGLIFGCFQSYSNLFKHLFFNFIYAIVFSGFCVFGERFFIIIKKIFPTDQYSMEFFKIDLNVVIFLSISFFISSMITLLLRMFLIKNKE